MDDDNESDGSYGSTSAAVAASRSEDVVEAVVTELASQRDCDPTAVPPLWDSVDTDALAAVVDSAGGDATDVTVSFSHAGCRVTVFGDGDVDVRPTGG